MSDVIELARHPDGFAASMALSALERRDDVPADWVDAAIRTLPRPSHSEDAFLLRAIARHAPGRAIGRILGRTEGIYPEYVADFVTARIEAGEPVDVETFRGNITAAQAEDLESYLHRFGGGMGDQVRLAFEEWRVLELFGSIGRVWQRPFDRPPTLLAGRRSEVVDLVVSALTAEPRRSVLLVGEHGAGKSALARAALDRIDDVTVFEAAASQVIAGQVYIGEIEGRVKQLADGMRGRNTVWLLPALQEALFAGQHHRSPQGLLDAMLPHVEAGSMTLVAEVTPTAFDVIRADRPRVMTAFEAIRVRTLDEEASIAVARHALEHDGLGRHDGRRDPRAELRPCQQFLPGVAPPGSLLRLVNAAALEAHDEGPRTFDGGDVLARLPRRPGCLSPSSTRGAPAPRGRPRVLRPAHPAAAGRRDLRRRADRHDQGGAHRPGRPLGVFLFLGPTGTGKTEIAKTLAQFLFGSPERLVRLDMSEFQTPGSR